MSIFIEIFILNFSNNFVALSYRITTQHLSGISDNVYNFNFITRYKKQHLQHDW